MVVVSILILKGNTVSDIENEKNKQFDSLNNVISNLQDSVVIAQAEREIAFYERGKLQDQADSLLSSLKRKQNRSKVTVKDLPNDEIIQIANRAYGGDTTGVQLSLAKNTIVYLVDVSKEHERILEEYDLLIKINTNYYSQLQIDSTVFLNYDKEISLKDQIIETTENKVTVSEKAYVKLKREYKKKNTIKDIIIITVGGLLTWQVLTK